MPPKRLPRVEPRPGRLKRCGGPCGFWKSVEEFNREKQRLDGRRDVCKVCYAGRRRELRNGAERKSRGRKRERIAPEE